MQLFREAEQENAQTVGLGVRVLLLAQEAAQGGLTARIAALGGRVEAEHELYAGLSMLLDDPGGYGLFVMACDGYGGISGGYRAFSRLSAVTQRIPVILISSDCRQQTFPADRGAPVLLRSPLSAVSLRIGLEYALRDRLVWLA